MAGYKETPRQKMIGMMYLVLTALLALNVSKQIMDAFLVVNESMENTTANFSKKLDNTYAKFQSQFSTNETKFGPYWNKAKKARALSESLTKYIDSLKYVVIMQTDNIKSFDSAKKMNLHNVKRKDAYNAATRFFIGSSQDGSAGESRILREKIEKFKEQMLALVDKKYRASIKMGLETNKMYMDADGNKQNWEMHNFYRTILAATVTILNEIKAEVKNIEFDIVSDVFAEVSAEDYKFDTIRAKVIPNTRFVFAGESYEAEIIVAAYETKGNPIVKWLPGVEAITSANEGNARSIEGVNGVVTLKIPAGGVGPQKFAGFIQIIDPGGQTKKYPFNEEYVVGRRAVSISPSQMLVFYRGVPNPLKIGIPGGGSDVQVTMTYGTVTKTDTNFNVNIPPSLTGGTNSTVVTVSAVYGGKRVTLGSERFRLKSIPEPDLTINQIKPPFADRDALSRTPTIYAFRPAGFDLVARYTVKSYSFVASGTGYQKSGTGATLTEDMVTQIKKSRRGQIIMIYDVVVQAPDGVRKLTNTITYSIN